MSLPMRHAGHAAMGMLRVWHNTGTVPKPRLFGIPSQFAGWHEPCTALANATHVDDARPSPHLPSWLARGLPPRMQRLG